MLPESTTGQPASSKSITTRMLAAEVENLSRMAVLPGLSVQGFVPVGTVKPPLDEFVGPGQMTEPPNSTWIRLLGGVLPHRMEIDLMWTGRPVSLTSVQVTSDPLGMPVGLLCLSLSALQTNSVTVAVPGLGSDDDKAPFSAVAVAELVMM